MKDLNQTGIFCVVNFGTHMYVANLLHDSDEGVHVLHVKSKRVRFPYEVLRVWVLGGKVSQCRFGLEELAVVTIDGWGDFRVQEDTARCDGF
jgi:hypothetical protein